MNYALVQLAPFEVVEKFDAIPEPIIWPNGDATHGVSLWSTHLGWAFVPIVTTAKPNDFYVATAPYVQSFDGTTLSVSPTYVANDLSETKSVLCARVDELAELSRQATITSGAGQAMVYLQKQVEAQACLKDPAPNALMYPLLNASVGIEGATVSDVANLVMSTASAWMARAADIERARLSGKAAINAAATVDEAATAYGAITW